MEAEELDSGEGVFKFSDYFEVKSLIGQGAFGKVMLALDRETGTECAVKIISKKTIKTEELERLRKEAQILSTLKHPNIVKFLNFKETKKRILIVMEYVRGGTLKQLIEQRYKSLQSGFTEEEASAIMKYILAAVDHIHSAGISHRDLKPENILIGDRNDFSTLKIADFGLSTEFLSEGQTQIFTQQCGTLAYMSPELAQEKFYTKEVDIWSCGIIMYILLVGRHPLLRTKDNTKSFLKKLKNPQWHLEKTSFSDLAKNLFLKLVQFEPNERYSAAKAYYHPWITRRFEGKIPLSAHETIVSFEQQQMLKRVMKAVCFLLYCKSEDEPESAKVQHKDIKQTDVIEDHERSPSFDHQQGTLQEKDSPLGSLPNDELNNQPKKIRTPSNSFRTMIIAKHPTDSSFERSPDFSKKATSLILDPIESKDQMAELGSHRPGSRFKHRTLRIQTSQASLKNHKFIENEVDKETEKLAQQTPMMSRAFESQFTPTMASELKRRRKSELSLTPKQDAEGSPKTSDNMIKLSKMFKVHSSKNVGELKKERELEIKPFSSKPLNKMKEDLRPVSRDFVINQNPSLWSETQGRNKKNIHADIPTEVCSSTLPKKADSKLRSPLANLQCQGNITPSNMMQGTLSSIQRMFGAPILNTFTNVLSECQSRKPLSKNGITISENVQDINSKLSNTSKERRLSGRAVFTTNKKTREVILNSEPDISPFNPESGETEKLLNYHNYQKENCEGFKFQRAGKENPSFTKVRQGPSESNTVVGLSANSSSQNISILAKPEQSSQAQNPMMEKFMSLKPKTFYSDFSKNKVNKLKDLLTETKTRMPAGENMLLANIATLNKNPGQFTRKQGAI